MHNILNVLNATDIYTLEMIKIINFILYMVNHNKEKAMAPHSSILAQKISWIEEPGGL